MAKLPSRRRCRSSFPATRQSAADTPMPEQSTRRSFLERGDRRVVVTGMGAITPLGNDVESTWTCMKAGRSGITRISLFDPARVDCKVAGEGKGFDAEAVMPRKEIRRN